MSKSQKRNTTSSSKKRPPQPGEQSPIAPHGNRRDKEGTLEKEGNVEPQQG